MFKPLITAGFVLAMAASAPAVAKDEQQQQGAQPTAEAAPAEKKICHREHVLGSIRPQRICHTASEWATINARSQSDLEGMRRSQNLGNSVSSTTR